MAKGQRNIYSEFADIQALEEQKEKVMNIFTEVKNGIKELSSMGIKLNTSETVKGVSGLTDQFDRQQETLSKSQKLLAEMAAKLNQLGTAEAKVNEEVRQTVDVVKKRNQEEIKSKILRRDEYEELVKQKLANKELNDSITLRIKLRNAEKGSQEQLALQYQKATKILKGLSEEQRNSARGQALEKFASDLNTKLSDIEKRTGNFRRNVGNYANSLADGFKTVADEISKLRVKQQGLQDLSKRNPIGFNLSGGDIELNKTTAALEQLVNVQAIGFRTNTSYTKTVKDLQKEYENLAVSGNVSEEFLKEFKTFVAEAKDSAADLKDEIKALSSDTRQLDLLVGTISAVASGFETASGLASLFGAESSDVEKATKRLVAIQSVANGVRELGKQITERGTAANKAYNFVLKQGEILFGKGATAAQKWGAALKSIGVVALITGIVLLIQKLDLFGDTAAEIEERNDKLRESFDALYETINRLKELDFKTPDAGNEITALKQELSLRQAQGASAEELFRRRKEIAEKEKKINDDRLQDAIENAEAEDYNMLNSITGLDALENAQQHYYDETKQALQELTNLRRDYNKALSSGNDDEIKEIERLLKVQEHYVEVKQREYDKVNSTVNDAQKSGEDLQNLVAEEITRRTRLEKKAALELFKFRKELIIEEQSFLASDDAINSVNKKVEAAKKVADAQIEILQSQKKFELTEEGLTKSRILLINEKFAEDVYKINLNLQNQIVSLRVKDVLNREKNAESDAERFYNEQKERNDKLNENNLKQFEQEQKLAEKYRDEALKQNVENFEKGLITKNEYDQRKVNAELSYQRTILSSQIKFYETQLALLKANGEDTTEADAALAKAKADLAQIGLDPKLAQLDHEKEKVEYLKEAYKELGRTIEDTFGNVISGIYDARKNQIQDQIDDIDRLKNAEIARITESTEEETIKAAKIKIVEANAQKDKEALEKKQRNIDRQKAIFERAYKAFQIASDARKSVAGITAAGAEAYAKALTVIPAPAGIPAAAAAKATIMAQIPFVLASSAANLISLLATPIPKYASGTDYSKGGPAEVAEDGPEIGVDPQGKLHFWQKRSVVNLIEGTKIYNARLTKDILNSSNGGIVHPDLSYLLNTDDRDDKMDRDMLHELKQIRQRSGVKVVINANVEATPYYINNMKF